MKTKHTPGPFRLCGDTDGWGASHDGNGCTEYRAIKDASGRVIALVVDQSDDMPPNLDTLTTGNKLAAAHDLLAALLGVLRVADRATDEFDAARAAIAKATGGAS